MPHISPGAIVRQNILMTFSDDVLDRFHGFSVQSLTVADSKKGRILRRMGLLDYSLWTEIFHYLTPKEIFSFMISSRGICSLFKKHMNLIRNEYILITSGTKHIIFNGLLHYLSPRVQLPLLKVESFLPFTVKDCRFISICAQKNVCMSPIFAERDDLVVLLVRPPRWLENIGEIKVHSEGMTLEQISGLIYLAKSLKGITIVGFYLPEDDDHLHLVGMSFGHIEKFACHEPQMSSLAYSLLSLFPNLKELNLFGLGDTFQQIPYCALRNLRRLNLKQTNISGQESLEILRQAPHLQYLNLSECRGIESGTYSDLEADSLPALRELILDGTNISGLDLIRFIGASAYLQIVSAKYCNLLHKKNSFSFIASYFARSAEACFNRIKNWFVFHGKIINCDSIIN